MTRPRRSVIAAVYLLLVLVAPSGLGATLGKGRYLDQFGRGIRAMNARLFHEAEFWFWKAEQANPIPEGQSFLGAGRSTYPYLPHYYHGIAILGEEELERAKQELVKARKQWAELKDKKLKIGLEKTFKANLDLLISAIDELSADQEILNLAWRSASISGQNIERYEELYALQVRRYQFVSRLAERVWQPNETDKLSVLHKKIMGFRGDLTWLSETAKSQSLTIQNATLASGGNKATCCVKKDQLEQGFYPKSYYDRKVAILISPVEYACSKGGTGCSSDLALTEAKAFLLEFQSFLSEKMGFDVIDLIRVVSGQQEFLGNLRSAVQSTIKAGEKNLVMVFFVGHACRVQTGSGLGYMVVVPSSTAPLCSSVPKYVPGESESQAIVRETALNALVDTSLTREDFEHEFVKRQSRNHFLLVAESCYSGDLAKRVGEYLPIQPSGIAARTPFYGVIASAREAELSSSKLYLIRGFKEYFERCGVGTSNSGPLVPGLSMIEMISTSIPEPPVKAKLSDEVYQRAEFFLPITKSCCDGKSNICPMAAKEINYFGLPEEILSLTGAKNRNLQTATCSLVPMSENTPN